MHSTASRRISVVVGALLLAICAVPARAQTPNPMAEWQYSGGVQLNEMFNEGHGDWRGQFGPGGALLPRYDGARQYHVQPGAAFDLRYKDLAFISSGEGVGLNLLRGPNLRAGVALSYDLGRRAADDASDLQGLGNIGPAPEVKLFADYAVAKGFPLTLRADLRRALGGSDGLIGDLGMYFPLPESSEKLAMFAGPTVTFADGRYMQRYFGVGAAQAARSGYRRFNADGGVKSVGFGFSLDYSLGDHWGFDLQLAVSQLLGDAADSPITKASTTGAVAFSLAYRF